MASDKVTKRKIMIGEAIRDLENAVLYGDIASMYMYEDKVFKLTNGELNMQLLYDVMEHNAGSGKVVVEFLQGIFEEAEHMSEERKQRLSSYKKEVEK